MNRKHSVDISIITIITVLIIVFWVSLNLNFGKNHWNRIIQADGKGYYAYLPAIFIYNDVNFGFFDKIEKEKYYDENTYYDYRSHYNNITINKYYSGTAIAMSPFFGGAHIITKLSGGDQDGYSRYYPLAVNIAAIFYLIIGLFFLRKILKLFDIHNFNIAVALFSIVFGTNIFYYTVSEPAMSHIYSWAFVNMFLYFALLYIRQDKIKHLLFAAIFLGIIILIRPVNGLIILSLPFLASNITNFKKLILRLFKRPLHLSMIILIPVFIFSIQFIIYKIQTGNFTVYSYGNEGFNFLKPEIYNFLFSFKKGMFIYTPILFISLWGFISIYRNNRFAFYSLSAFLIILIWILSSWWNWYYGGSFATRVFIEYYAFFALLLCLSLQNLKNKTAKITYLTLIALLTILCQIQTYQYRYYIIHWSDMDFNRYVEVFLKMSKQF